MALQNRGTLDPTASVASPEYRRAMLLHSQADLIPARRQAQQEMQDELASRGVSHGGAGMAAALANRNSFIQQLLQGDQKVGMGQADAGEGNRQTLESRAWALDDRAKQAALEDEFQKWDEEDAANAKQAKAIGTLFQGLGKAGGTSASGRWGAEAKGFGQDELSRVRVSRDTGQFDSPVVRY